MATPFQVTCRCGVPDSPKLSKSPLGAGGGCLLLQPLLTSIQGPEKMCCDGNPGPCPRELANQYGLTKIMHELVFHSDFSAQTSLEALYVIDPSLVLHSVCSPAQATSQPHAKTRMCPQ